MDPIQTNLAKLLAVRDGTLMKAFFFSSSLAGLPSLIRRMVCMDVKHISFFAVLRA